MSDSRPDTIDDSLEDYADECCRLVDQMKGKDSEIARLHQLETETGALIECLNKQHSDQIAEIKELVTDLADHLDYWERAEGFLWDEDLKARVKAVSEPV